MKGIIIGIVWMGIPSVFMHNLWLYCGSAFMAGQLSSSENTQFIIMVIIACLAFILGFCEFIRSVFGLLKHATTRSLGKKMFGQVIKVYSTDEIVSTISDVSIDMLVIDEYDVITKHTCVVGRDWNKYRVNDFVLAKKIGNNVKIIKKASDIIPGDAKMKLLSYAKSLDMGIQPMMKKNGDWVL